MKYYIDTEFLEGRQGYWFKSKPTIDLISIGIVAEDGREYYAVSKDFNLKAVWNRLDTNTGPDEPMHFWHRENLLKSIFQEFVRMEQDFYNKILNSPCPLFQFRFRTFKSLLKKYGKSNAEIAEDIQRFVKPAADKPVFYGYYSAYDWVAFCQLFGIMMDLPKGFPYYCKDLKQMQDDIDLKQVSGTHFLNPDWLSDIEHHPDYPKQPAQRHNALADAKWIKSLHDFLISL